ncbi:YlcG family protein [Salmonella enterica]|nr:YlcG family protein [Salmonella enterica]EEH8407643.1 YlcG family protein [Salmonella enterica]EFT1745532.1 YlcG family protein [Salmonella enterica]
MTWFQHPVCTTEEADELVAEYRGSVLVDYRILRNFVRIYHSAGAA